MDEKTSRIIETFTANPILQEMKNVSKKNYGITQEYNKQNRDKLWDSAKGKKEFKETIFNEGKRTFDDPISGQQLHSTQKAAQKKYHKDSGSKTWAKHSPETDHIIPLKEIHNRLKGNPFLSDVDLKEIANNQKNYRVTSKSYNASKGEKSDFEFFFDKENVMSVKGRTKLIKEKIGAEASIATQIAVKTVENVGAEFIDGAIFSIEASAIPLMVEGVNNLCLVANGEKECSDAVKDMGKLTLSVAGTGGTIRVVSTGVTNILKNSGKEVLQKIADSNQVMQIITVSLIVKDSVIKYLNGEIDGKQFFEEIGEKGTGIVSGAIGAIAGQALIPIPIVGAVIGSMIVSTVCMNIYKSYTTINEYKKIESCVDILSSQALYEMKRQQEFLKLIIKEEYKEWDQTFNKGYEMIYNGIFNDNADMIVNGLENIMYVFGKDVAFKNQQSFDTMFFDNNSIFNM